MSKKQRQTIIHNLALLVGSLFICFLVIEAGYRVFDPFPYFTKHDINRTEHGNLSMFDPVLGWKGVPRGSTEFVTENNRVWLENNKDGFRDIEHQDSSNKKPAIAFLGDSFTWGYEVNFDEMFVNKLRDELPSYEVFNLAHRGYGTDQEFLTLKSWHNNQPLKLVVLMFSENDIADNNSGFRYAKPKPRFLLVDDKLVLRGVPVPEVRAWKYSRPARMADNTWKTNVKELFMRSHFLHDISFRVNQLLSSNKVARKWAPGNGLDITLTARIIEEVEKEVEKRGAKLVVFFIPSKSEVEHLGNLPPYQTQIAHWCLSHHIVYFDLAQDFEPVWRRTYFRLGSHWNRFGHDVAEKAIYRHLTRDVGVRDQQTKTNKSHRRLKRVG